jgi:hypothetical protein
VLPIGDTALLVQGAAVLDLHYLVRLGLRARNAVDGSAPSVHHLRLLQALTDIAGTHVRSPGRADVREVPDLSESEMLMGTGEAADRLGITSRSIRRLAPELGGQKVKGAWRLDAALVDAAALRRERTA